MATDPVLLAEYIDRLVTVEVRLDGLPRHMTVPLYDACRTSQGAPLTHLAASALRERIGPGDSVFLVTGAGMPPSLPQGETDGPLGAASLARALGLAFAARPVFVVQANHTAPLAAAAEALGVGLAGDPAPASGEQHGIEVMPLGVAAGAAAAPGLFARHAPSAVIFIEKIGPNRAGYYHGVLGYGRAPDEVANMVPLLNLARDRGILTIGIGDGGNEIGFGRVEDTVRRVHPYGSACRCPCGGGIATVATTDITVAASVSNWGAYGVVAQLGFLLGRPDLLHSPQDEAVMLARCVEAGAADGASGLPSVSVDGASLEADVAIVRLLHGMVAAALTRSARAF